jgi:hypothetical protein
MKSVEKISPTSLLYLYGVRSFPYIRVSSGQPQLVSAHIHYDTRLLSEQRLDESHKWYISARIYRRGNRRDLCLRVCSRVHMTSYMLLLRHMF